MAEKQQRNISTSRPRSGGYRQRCAVWLTEAEFRKVKIACAKTGKHTIDFVAEAVVAAANEVK